MSLKRCGQCGSKEIKESDVKGKSFPFRDFPAALVVKSAKFLQCQKCGETILSVSDTKKMDSLLEESITLQINHFIDTVMTRENCKQSDVAAHIGVSPEYLSEIKSGRKIPKFQTFNFLKTLACEPSSFAVSDPAYVPKQESA
jgi:hypothetical protein